MLMHATFRPTQQCLAAAAKANRALMQMIRTVASRKADVLLPLYKAFVRPHLEYCVQAWAPILTRDAQTLERVQRRFTNMVSGLRGRPYSERLTELGLFSLPRRRQRGDLIEVYKQLHGSSTTTEPLLTRSWNVSLRGHDLKLQKPRVNGRLRANSFACRVVNPWNKLPSHVVLAPSVAEFKRRLDACWLQVFPDSA